MTTASLAKVKARFGAYLKECEKSPVVITRNRKPVAALIAVTDLEELERLAMAYSPRLKAIVAASRKEISEGDVLTHEEFWAEVESDVRPQMKKSAKKSRG